ncbi:MAG: hypothetical protein JWO10_1333, partial [Microbacteriaceae bacterium]|nr:hypothetical protein [Microbacteriaceae bacterium]
RPVAQAAARTAQQTPLNAPTRLEPR